MLPSWRKIALSMFFFPRDIFNGGNGWFDGHDGDNGGNGDDGKVV